MIAIDRQVQPLSPEVRLRVATSRAMLRAYRSTTVHALVDGVLTATPFSEIRTIADLERAVDRFKDALLTCTEAVARLEPLLKQAKEECE